MGLRVLAAAVFTGVLLVAPATALAGDSVIASVPGPTAIDAYGGRVVWSEHGPEGYRLVEHRDGAVRRLPIAPAPNEFEFDLGPSSEGGTVVIYSRCPRTPTPHLFGAEQLGCDLFVYDFASGRERAITRANSEVDERFPTIWGKRIAFTRTYEPKGKRSYRLQRAYWRPFPGRGRSRRLRGAPGQLPILKHLDMRGRQVGLVWGSEYGGGDVRLVTTGRRTTLLGTAPWSGAADREYLLVDLSFTGGFVNWAVATDGPAIGELRRYDLSRRREERATVQISPYTAGFAQDGGVSYVVRPSSETGCGLVSGCAGPYEIHRLDGLAFEPAPRLPLG